MSVMAKAHKETGELVIEKDKPIPTISRYGPSGTLDLMSVGDSVVVETRSFSNAFRARAYKLGLTITARQLPDGRIRVWRTR